MQWVEQVEKGGCGIACLAMLLDTTYARIVEMAPDLCGKCGVEEAVMFDFLAEHGYAVQRVEQAKASDGTKRKKWPPKPWADRHLVMVMQTKDDVAAHYVVMDAKGNVYDPADPEYRRTRLSRYYSVEWVAAVVKVSEEK